MAAFDDDSDEEVGMCCLYFLPGTILVEMRMHECHGGFAKKVIEWIILNTE